MWQLVAHGKIWDTPDTKGLRIRLKLNSTYLVALLLLLGLALRCALASLAPLNPDEAYYYLIGRQATAFATWKQSLTQVHPPLFFFLIRYWSSLGYSEPFLRVLPAVAGTLAALMMYKWIRALLNRSAAWFALAFGAFSPFLIALAIELRQYSTLLLFVFCALYFFERKRYWLAATFYSAAILTHYSAILLLPYFPMLLLARGYRSGRLDWPSARSACAWLLMPLALFALLYFTHIRTFAAREMTRQAKEDWLAGGYWNPHNENAAAFLAKRTYAVMESQYSLPIVSLRAGGWMLLAKLAVIAIVLLAAALSLRRTLSKESAVSLRCYSAAALVALLFAGILAVLGYYPIGPTRHSAVLIAVTLPVVCLLLSELCRERPSSTLLVSLLLMSALLLYRGSVRPFFQPAGRKEAVARAMRVLHNSVSANQVVFSDYGSALVMNYYLQPSSPAIDFLDEPAGAFHDYQWNGINVVCSSAVRWSSTDSFLAQLAALQKLRPFMKGVYVVNAGWGQPLAPAFQHPPYVQWLIRSAPPEVFWLPLNNPQFPSGPAS